MLSSAAEKAACSVCWDEFEVSSKAVQLPCAHLYHEDCILPWIEQVSTLDLYVAVYSQFVVFILHFLDYWTWSLNRAWSLIFSQHKQMRDGSTKELNIRRWDFNDHGN